MICENSRKNVVTTWQLLKLYDITYIRKVPRWLIMSCKLLVNLNNESVLIMLYRIVSGFLLIAFATKWTGRLLSGYSWNKTIKTSGLSTWEFHFFLSNIKYINKWVWKLVYIFYRIKNKLCFRFWLIVGCSNGIPEIPDYSTPKEKLIRTDLSTKLKICSCGNTRLINRQNF